MDELTTAVLAVPAAIPMPAVPATLAAGAADLVERWRDLSTELWLAAGGLTAVWFAIFGVLAAATNPRRVEPGPETLDLGGPEPPAVVNLITRDWRLGHEALPATLLDLAARQHLAIDQVGEHTLVRTRRGGPAQETHGLTGYELMVLDHVVHLAGQADDGVVPAEALTTGPDEHSKRWWRRFHHGVRDDARARGLARPRWSAWMTLTFTIGAAAAAVAVALAVSATWRESDNEANPNSDSSRDSDPVTASIGTGILAFGALMATVGAASRDRDTPAGREAAARWLGLRDLLSTDPIFAEQPPAGVAIWDRHLAYGATLGVAPGAVRALPLGTESDEEAWSPLGGRWRLVQVRYPTRLPPGFGRHPARVALVGLLQLALLVPPLLLLPGLPGAIGDAARDVTDEEPAWLDTAATGVALTLAVVGGAIVVRAAAMLLVGSADLVGGRRLVEGRVLRHRVRGDDNSRQWRVAVDDGSADTVRAWRLSRPVDAPQGSTVRAHVTRHLVHVKDLARADTPRRTDDGAADADDGDGDGDGTMEDDARAPRPRCDLRDRSHR